MTALVTTKKLYRVFLLLPVLMLGGCDEKIYETINETIDDIVYYFLIPTQVISQGMDLDEHWREIIPDPPLKVSKAEQKIVIKPPGDLNWSRIIIPGGYKPNKGPTVQPPNIEVQIVSEQGTIYPLNSSTGGSDGGIGFSYWSEEEDLASHRDLPKDGDQPHSHHKSLPKDLVYTKVRIRSDKPGKIGEISWVCYTSK